MKKLLLLFTALIAAPLAGAPVAFAKDPGPLHVHHGIHKIRHVVIIMQENRSFDSYFGTFPGAHGIPGETWYGGGGSNPGAIPCVSDPDNGGCQQPFHDMQDENYGGPHSFSAAKQDIDSGAMDGFVKTVEAAPRCTRPNQAGCSQGTIDVMGYHDGSDIPNYWAYASDFVLQDRMFDSVSSWSLPSHLYMVSEWSAKCGKTVASCVNDPNLPSGSYLAAANKGTLHYRWTDITYLLHKYGVSWKYYMMNGPEPDCASGAMACAGGSQSTTTPGIWNPLLSFRDVTTDKQTGNIQPLSSFYADASSGGLPAVSWVVPNNVDSEHPPNLVTAGQTHVTAMINAIMSSPDWDSTAIFLAWDDWGGFYDHENPPTIDQSGYGLRVPALVISPYAKRGYIDHQTLSFDAYNKFIEDDFLGRHRLDPATDGRPDPRPSVRESNPALGNLASDFDFNQPPRPPVILPVDPATDLRQCSPRAETVARCGPR